MFATGSTNCCPVHHGDLCCYGNGFEKKIQKKERESYFIYCSLESIRVNSHLRFLNVNYFVNYLHNNGFLGAFIPAILQTIAITIQKKFIEYFTPKKSDCELTFILQSTKCFKKDMFHFTV